MQRQATSLVDLFILIEDMLKKKKDIYLIYII